MVKTTKQIGVINILRECAERTLEDAKDPLCNPRRMAERMKQMADLALAEIAEADASCGVASEVFK